MGLNPEDYLPLSQENEKRFQEDKGAIDKFIYLSIASLSSWNLFSFSCDKGK